MAIEKRHWPPAATITRPNRFNLRVCSAKLRRFCPPMTSAELQEAVARAQHDLRNPLGQVLGFCEMLLYHVEPLPPKDIREAVEAIHEISEQMLREMDRVLDPDKPPALPEEVNALKS